MKNLNKIMLGLILSIFLFSFVSAATSVCTMQFTRHATAYTPVTYYKGETVTLDIVCSNNGGAGTTYQATWRNSSNAIVQTSFGNPAANGVHFQIIYNIPAGYSSNLLNVTYNDSKAAGVIVGGDNATIAATNINGIYLSQVTFSGKWLGLSSGFRVQSLTDYQGYKISGAQCEVGVLTNDLSGSIAHISTTAIDGTFAGSFLTGYDNFQEGESYLLRAKCYCGLNNTDKACVNENGVTISNTVGTVDYPFTTNTWVLPQDNMPIALSNGTLASTNQIFYSGYDNSVYWWNNFTNYFNAPIIINTEAFIVNNKTGQTFPSSNLGSFTLNANVSGDSRLRNIELPKNIPTGLYYVRVFATVKYDGLTPAIYIIKTNTFNVTGPSESFQFNGVTMDKADYFTGSNLQICGNITSTFDTRVEFEISYRYRCGNATDTTQQSAIDSYTEIRGINPSTNQVRCVNLPIPHDDRLLFKTSSCQAIVTIKSPFINTFDNKITLQGNTFTITDYGMFPDYQKDPAYPIVRLFPEWRRFDNVVDGISKSYYQAKINITKVNETILDPSNAIGDADWDIYTIFTEKMPTCQEIYNYTVEYANGTKIINPTEEKSLQWEGRDGIQHSRCSLGIENINFSNPNDDYFVVKIYFEDWAEKQANSLEGINSSSTTGLTYSNRSATALETIANKTGTFHLSIDCPTSVDIARDSVMNCKINAQIEDTQLVTKEVDFTCYIVTDKGKESQINFNQMINRSRIVMNKEFILPSGLSYNKQYEVKCEASYYNLGKRTDTFSDTFNIKRVLITEKAAKWSAAILLAGLIIIFVVAKKRKRNSKVVTDDNETFK